MRWTVTARARDRATGEFVPYKDGRFQRIEVIDTDRWGFGPAGTAEEVKRIYEGWWNEFPSTPPEHIVEVLDVIETD